MCETTVTTYAGGIILTSVLVWHATGRFERHGVRRSPDRSRRNESHSGV